MTKVERRGSIGRALQDHADATEQVRAAEIAQVLAVAALCDLHRVDESRLFEGHAPDGHRPG